MVQPARAHPHVWVSVETTVLYDKGTITGLRHRWYFDEIYSSMAIQGLDTNNDGVVDRSELAELAKINMEGLQQFNYFTVAKLGNYPLSFETPSDFFLEHTETDTLPGKQFAAPDSAESAPAEPKELSGFWSRLAQSLTGSGVEEEPKKRRVLALEFTLPFSQPVLAEAEGFNFATYDPSFFIWFDLVERNPVRLADGAPPGCKVHVTAPRQGESQVQQLGEAAFDSGVNITFSYARTVRLSCAK